MSRKRILFILALAIIPPVLAVAGTTALGWLCFEWSLRGVGTVLGVCAGRIAILGVMAEISSTTRVRGWLEELG